MSSENLEQAKTRIASFLKPGEKLEWVDTFCFRSTFTRKIFAIITIAAAAVFVVAVTFVLPQFGLVNADSRSHWIFTGMLVSGLILVMLLVDPKSIVALTNKRVLVTSMPRKGEGDSKPWILELYSNDITKVERVDTRGGRLVRLKLNPNRRGQLAHIRELSLCELSSQVDEAANQLERYRSSGVVCLPEDRDDPAKTDLKALLGFSAKSIAGQHSAKELLMLAGFFVLIFGLTVKQYYDSQSWPSTTATVTYSEIKVAEPTTSAIHGKLPNTLYCFDRNLKYKVKGVECSELEENALCFDSREAAVDAKKPVTAEVFYDPEKPTVCTTDRKGDLLKGSVALFLAGAMLSTAAELKVFKPKNNASRVVMAWVFAAINVVIGLTLYTVFTSYFPGT